MYTGSQPWTVDAGANKVYAVTSKSTDPKGDQFLDIINAKTGDIEESLPFADIMGKEKCSGCGIGGLALV